MLAIQDIVISQSLAKSVITPTSLYPAMIPDHLRLVS